MKIQKCLPTGDMQRSEFFTQMGRYIRYNFAVELPNVLIFDQKTI